MAGSFDLSGGGGRDGGQPGTRPVHGAGAGPGWGGPGDHQPHRRLAPADPGGGALRHDPPEIGAHHQYRIGDIGLRDGRDRPLLRQNPEWVASTEARIPAGRVGAVTDLDGAIVFLASDLSDYVTGQMLFVDGGFTIGAMRAMPAKS
jgi:hypothetical protein